MHLSVSGVLVRVWALDVWGELVPSKIFNPPFPVLKAGHSVSYSYICDVCLEWVNGVGFFLFFLECPVWLVCYAYGFHVCTGNIYHVSNLHNTRCAIEVARIRMFL